MQAGKWTSPDRERRPTPSYPIERLRQLNSHSEASTERVRQERAGRSQQGEPATCSCLPGRFKRTLGGTFSSKNRPSQPAPSVDADTSSNHAHNEGRHDPDARAKPPADRAAHSRTDERQELGHDPSGGGPSRLMCPSPPKTRM